MGGWEKLKAKNWSFQKSPEEWEDDKRVKGQELEIAKVKCKNGRMGKVKCQELEVTKNQLQNE